MPTRATMICSAVSLHRKGLDLRFLRALICSFAKVGRGMMRMITSVTTLIYKDISDERVKFRESGSRILRQQSQHMCLIIDPRSLTKVGGKDSIPSTSSNMRLPHRCSPVGTLETTHSGDEICTRRPVATSTAEIIYRAHLLF